MIGVASRFNGWIFPNIKRFPAAASKNESKQQSVVWIHFYPACKAGRVEWNEMEWNGFGASPPQTKKMSCT